MSDHKIETIEVTSLRPNRSAIITKDEITSLKIDLNILSFDQLLEKYWNE